MDKLRREILNITKRKPEIGLVYYNELLDIIDDYHYKKPDTSVETCKAIIEGISKLILHKINGMQIHILDNKWKFNKLINRSIDSLKQRNTNLNDELLTQLLQVFHFINIDRNKHCDIGHGRASVKEQVNCSDYSQMVAGFTESVSIYLLKKLDESIVAEDVYESEQMQDFNHWLDESIENFPIKTEKYSKLLYQSDKEGYYAIYNDDYLEEINNEKEYSTDTSFSHELKEEKLEYPTTPKIHTYQEEVYFKKKELQIISTFADTNDLYNDKLTELLNEVVLRQSNPSPNRCLQTINFKPKLHDRPKVGNELQVKIIRLIERLKIIEK